MVIMRFVADNFLCFNDFCIDFSYPKKIVGSALEEEHIAGMPNFRYKKINIIMGSNATGKTALGRMFEAVFDFIAAGNGSSLVKMVYDPSHTAYFILDYVGSGNRLVRIHCTCDARRDGSRVPMLYLSNCYTTISARDSYESAARRLNIDLQKPCRGAFFCMESASPYGEGIRNLSLNIDEVRKDFKEFTMFFTSASASLMKMDLFDGPGEREKFRAILRALLITLDPSIEDVVVSKELADSYLIRRGRDEIIIQNGKLLSKEKLSTGTADGVSIAMALAMILMRKSDIFYIDEKFPFIQSDIEKRILGMMAFHLGPDSQLFFTTHNTDVLDMNFPKHSFIFLKKRMVDKKAVITALSAGDVIKNKNKNLRISFENDEFDSLPDEDLLDEIDSLMEES